MVRATIDRVFFDESTNEAIRASVPEWSVPFFELVTHLGDGATLVLLATLLYWFGADSRREQRALVIAIGLGALAISAGMKGYFVTPRPDLAFTPEAYPGYSFPSAHALGSAAFYAALAAVADTGTRRQRYAIAGVVIALVCLSRVVIGVHYLGDVVVGALVGLAFVAIVLRSPITDPGSLFTLAGLLAVVGYLLGARVFTTLTIGASFGAMLAWAYVAKHPSEPSGAAILVLAYLCIPVLVALRATTSFWILHSSVEVLGYAAITAAVLIVPNVAERMNHWPPVEWLQENLPFTGRRFDPRKLFPPTEQDA